LIAAGPATTRPLATPKPLPPPPQRPLLDLSRLNIFHRLQFPGSASSGSLAGAGEQWSKAQSVTGLSLGPIRAQVGPNDDPREGLSSYGLQGMDQLGTEMMENHNGQSAKILFVWPTDK
jgi:hypothetical protein